MTTVSPSGNTTAAVTYTPIATNTLSSAASTVTFSSIPGTYTDLVIVHQGTAVTTAAVINMELNSDTTAGNYSLTFMYGDGTSAASGRYTGDKMVGRNYIAQQNNILQIMNYSNSTTYKTTLSRSNSAGNLTQALVSLWRNTAAVTSIRLFVGAGNFDTGTTFTLYGIGAA